MLACKLFIFEPLQLVTSTSHNTANSDSLCLCIHVQPAKDVPKHCQKRFTIDFALIVFIGRWMLDALPGFDFALTAYSSPTVAFGTDRLKAIAR